MNNLTGRITRIISNLYTVDINGKEYMCRARGKFRNDEISPLVGDIVTISDENYIMEIHPRNNELTRPNVANVDAAVIVTTVKRPDFSSSLLDKMLTNIIYYDIKPIICFSKYDLLDDNEKQEIDEIIKYYESIGIDVVINDNLNKLTKLLSGKTVVVTGQTGAGKSTLINKLDNNLNLKTDDISDALNRGKHTTRHVELYKIDDYFIVDTPGFSALDPIDDKENIRFTFPEFKNDECKFNNCMHLNEIGCKVKEQVNNLEIMQSRYNNYKKMVE